ncbi:MAG: hypothetical protein JWP52_4700 [Rhizobacter sp.]|jgi:hypothetical protein|nr:hypothetical protein [Rhizobacter sp.]
MNTTTTTRKAKAPTAPTDSLEESAEHAPEDALEDRKEAQWDDGKLPQAQPIDGDGIPPKGL